MKNFIVMCLAAAVISVPAMMVDAALQKQAQSRPSTAQKTGFEHKMEDRLNYLTDQIRQLRGRRNDIIKKRDAQYKEELAGLDRRRDEVQAQIESLKSGDAALLKSAKTKLTASMKTLENEIERVEDEYTERNFGLADILGI